MKKTKEEINELKQECEVLKEKLEELTQDELKQVTGGTIGGWNNIEHSKINVKDQEHYSIFYGNQQ